jgi:16S rRNA (cytosine967-C5)-methyltransferase
MHDRDARQRAIDLLEQVETRGVYVGLDEVDAAGTADARLLRQTRDYVSGVTRRRRYLDFLIDSFLRSDPARFELRLRLILRLALYEILFQQTPAHAAVNEAVRLTRKLVRPAATGIVNGILRNVLRRADHLPEPDSGDPVADLAVRHSHPDWMVARWSERFSSSELVAFLEHNNRRPHFSLRINTARISVVDFQDRLRALEIPFETSPFLPYFVRVPRLQEVIREKLLAEGLCAVQDESAALVVRLLDPRPGETILDTCSAPGGKTLHAAQLMCGEGRIHALDLHEGRLGLVERGARTEGVGIIHTAVRDVVQIHADEFGQVDAVLLDAPCSGLGVLARRADLRWNKSPESISELAALQDRMLDSAAAIVRQGGRLVYSTCTIEPEENGDRVSAFLGRNSDFAIESARDFVPEEMVTVEGYFASLPHRDGIDGAFGARLKRIR